MPRSSILWFLKTRTVLASVVLSLFAVPVTTQNTPLVIKLDVSAGLGRTFGGGSRDVPVSFAFAAVPMVFSWAESP